MYFIPLNLLLFTKWHKTRQREAVVQSKTLGKKIVFSWQIGVVFKLQYISQN